MQPVFSDHPLIRQFNELKIYFRRHETPETRQRVRAFREFARLISLAGIHIAFDFLGSMNFGQVQHDSDVDLVMYLDCQEHDSDCGRDTCEQFRRAEETMLRTLIETYTDHPYELQVVDCINLHHLGREIERGEPESPILLRFGFYRSICRLANAPLVRPYQLRLQNNTKLMEAMRPHLFTIFDGLARSAPHTYSFEKYRQRLSDLNVQIPPSIEARIKLILGQGK